ncbi:MAG: histone deacetylase family protein [Alphaproteobacteria bacterium]|nr:histone deacetylase family protein [Alphaproteobacteria bacterium]MBU1562659.1 histone deacetylase family protein [Alphaproteobacteria bacterium]MBU2303415.1 histone deacetylase family protein [Alphaproteobacteria bacterium]MBU2366940.1 histone deacetylase family protein [Alphaproteobacteria bacterium]
MTTLLVSQPNFADHVTPPGHPERADRIRAVEEALSRPRFDKLLRRNAPSGDLMLAELVHDSRYLSRLRDGRPAEGIGQIDADTFISADSLAVVATGLGGALNALDAVLLGEVDNAFCAIRPPGHHAEIATPMGFCLINTIAVVAREAQRKYGAERIAIVDFDVHHGNGTQDIFKADSTVFYASSHQMPLYPGTGKPSETGVGNITNVPLDPNSDGSSMREAYASHIIPALIDFSPDLILISAGFDAHERDPLAQLNWNSADFGWLTGKLMDVAERACGNRIVSLLEGGYDLKGLAGGASHHVAMLMDGAIGRLDD